MAGEAKRGRLGGCACGGVRYGLAGDLGEVVYCHCETCRRTSGHVVAATRLPRERLGLACADTLTWYASTPGYRRGFCGRCGASLFWERIGSGKISVMAGTLDTPTGLAAKRHIFVAEKGDYYAITDGLPVHDLRDA